MIISLINIKGGVGKTMTAINLAGAMAINKKKVLLIDNDSQSNLTDIILGDKIDLLEGKETLFDIYENNSTKVKDTIINLSENIGLIPNKIESAILEKSLHNKITRESILKKRKKEIQKLGYDFVIIDNSPFLGLMVSNALGLSDYYLEVIDNSLSALKGLNIVNNVIAEVKESDLNSKIKELGILRNKFDKVTKYTKQFNEYLESEKYNLFKTIIYETVKLKEANLTNNFIQNYNKEHSKAYNSLYKEIVNIIN